MNGIHTRRILLQGLTVLSGGEGGTRGDGVDVEAGINLAFIMKKAGGVKDWMGFVRGIMIWSLPRSMCIL